MSNDKSKIWLSPPHMGGKEFEYVREAFDTNWIAPIGPHVDGFEADLHLQIGIPCAVLSSGTAAIHLALILAGVKPGDEVLCQSLTFCGSSHPILYQGATPVFIDSEAETWNMDPALLRQAVKDRIKHGRKPKAIIYVHLYGMPAKVDEIRQIASEFEIFLIEDAAEALGSTYKGEQAGRFGDISTLSFNGNKIITSSGGGALASFNDQWVKKAKFLATQARDAAPHYEHSEVGFNYRMSNVSAAIGRGQLTVLQERVDKRRKNFDQYRDALGAIGGISFLEEPEGTKSNRWLTTILVDPKVTKGVTHDTLRLALDKENIESRPLWKPMHLQPVYSGVKSYLSGVSERLFSQGLCLPSGSNLSESDQERVIAIVANVLKEA